MPIPYMPPELVSLILKQVADEAGQLWDGRTPYN